jgi:hypothetical protein
VREQDQADVARTALAGSPGDLRAFENLVAGRRP